MYKKLIVFYFTGTGNALAAANWILEVAHQKGITTELIKITPSLQLDPDFFDKNTLIGFCYPTHGFNAPPIVIDFFIRFPKVKNHVFLLNTRAGMKLYKIFTPGLSGMAQLIPTLILWFKGLKTIGFQPMDLPSNWISVHPGVKEKVVDSIFRRCERKTKDFASRTLNGQRTWKGLHSIVFDVLVAPISVAYYFLGRFALAKTFVAGYKCNSCQLCVKECPVQAIKMKSGTPFWTHKCESCMHCMNSCPQRAIETPHLFTFVVWYFVFSVVPVLTLGLFAKTGGFVEENYKLLVNLFLLVAGIPLVFFFYQTLHFLMNFKWFNRLIIYTSLTRFRFWRRYKAPKKYLKSGTDSR